MQRRAYIFAVVVSAAKIVPLMSLGAAEYAAYREIYHPIPALPPIPADNSLTDKRIAIGQMLYWDRRTSKTGQTSCGFCHHPAYYGAEPMDRSLGVYGELHAANTHRTERRPPPSNSFPVRPPPSKHRRLGR